MVQNMHKVEISQGKFILYNGAFFVKQADHHIVWTSNRADAQEFSWPEAEEVLEKVNRFLQSAS